MSKCVKLCFENAIRLLDAVTNSIKFEEAVSESWRLQVIYFEAFWGN